MANCPEMLVTAPQDSGWGGTQQFPDVFIKFSSTTHHHQQQKVVPIRHGLPKFDFTNEFSYTVPSISAILMTWAAILESCGDSQSYCSENGYELDPNQDLFGLGDFEYCWFLLSIIPINRFIGLWWLK